MKQLLTLAAFAVSMIGLSACQSTASSSCCHKDGAACPPGTACATGAAKTCPPGCTKPCCAKKH